MSGARSWRAAGIALALAAAFGLAGVPAVAHAAGAGSAGAATAAPGAARFAAAPGGFMAAAADTTLDGFLEGLADSTDTYFGITAAPLDTAGLDSARAWALAHPGYGAARRRLRVLALPDFDFNRVDGPLYSATLAAGWPDHFGRFAADLGWAAGPNDVMGGARWTRTLQRRGARWTMRAEGGRRTDNLDRSRPDSRFSTMSGFLRGGDRQHYLRREGGGVSLWRESATLRLEAGWRDHLETPRATTATWNLFGKVPEVTVNAPAARGRAMEFAFDGLWRVPRTPLMLSAVHHTSSRSAGSDFEYRRTQVAAGADVALGEWLSLVPQVAYGRLEHEVVPQAAFYLGGSRTLRSVPGQSLGGTRMALGRIELIAVPDLLALVRAPHPDMFPLQAAVFAAAGAVWGGDPYGGSPRPGGDTPDEREWKSEAGFSLLYQPGLPEPAGFLRFNFAWPLGPAREDARFTVSYVHALDFMRAFGR